MNLKNDCKIYSINTRTWQQQMQTYIPFRVNPDQFFSIGKKILDDFIKKDNIIKLEYRLKKYYVKLIYYLGDCIIYTRSTTKSNAKQICKKIVNIFELFYKLIEIFGISDSYLKATEFKFTSENLNYYCRLFSNRWEENEFRYVFNNRMRYANTMSLVSEISRISEENVDYHSNIIRLLWFKLNISNFFRSYIQNYDYKDNKIAIPDVRLISKYRSETSVEIAKEVYKVIKKF